MPDQGEKQGLKGLGDGGEKGMMLGAKTDTGLGKEAPVGGLGAREIKKRKYVMKGAPC